VKSDIDWNSEGNNVTPQIPSAGDIQSRFILPDGIEVVVEDDVVVVVEPAVVVLVELVDDDEVVVIVD
jgi:hypothetical protein